MSNPWHLPAVLHILSQLRPLRVLDIGVGLGTYGFMVRQFMDIGHERLKREEWLLTIDGIEIFEPYRNPVWGYAYNEIMMGDVREKLRDCGNYDVILCNDVLEHFPEDEVSKLVASMLEHAPVVIATTPNREWPQGVWAGNEAETHHCVVEAATIPCCVGGLVTGPTSCYVAARDADKARLVREAIATCPQLAPSLSTRLGHRIKRKVQRLLDR